MEALTALATELNSFRDDGKSSIIFDSRDCGTYRVNSWDATVAMLRKADPTGLSIGMLINLPGALLTSSARDGGLDFMAYRGVHLYKQSPKHRTYNARCYFEGKKLPSHVVRFRPDSAQALSDMLGLKSTLELPEFLQGWARTQSWTTAKTHAHSSRALPVDPSPRWCFSDQREQVLEASLCLNVANLPGNMPAHVNQLGVASDNFSD